MDNLAINCLRITAVGSRITCDPAPTNTDADYLVLVADHAAFRQVAFDNGYELGGSLLLGEKFPLDSQDIFSSYVKGEVNLIVTMDFTFHMRFLAASSVAKRLNMLVKDDRIALFQAVLYGNSCDEPQLLPDSFF